jgi:hypothetical protein
MGLRGISLGDFKELMRAALIALIVRGHRRELDRRAQCCTETKVRE